MASYAQACIVPFMNVNKNRIIMKSFTKSQFAYCPLIWMLHSRGLNNKIKRIHKRVLRMTCTENYSPKIAV